MSQIDFLEQCKSIAEADTFPVYVMPFPDHFSNYSPVVSPHIHKSFHEFIILDAMFLLPRKSSYWKSTAFAAAVKQNYLCGTYLLPQAIISHE